MLIQHSLLHATQALNQKLWTVAQFLLTAGPVLLSLEAHLPHRSCQTFPSPASSPDISPIEHIWHMKESRLPLPGNVDHLVHQLEQSWQEIPQETIRVPYLSMPRRVVTCIRARIGATPY
ncbi:transposable element Tcb1 transposase [Trichonephila clavipes]|nr:transposable element Tcb1 transposase [Trichonephila clavipes]